MPGLGGVKNRDPAESLERVAWLTPWPRPASTSSGGLLQDRYGPYLQHGNIAVPSLFSKCLSKQGFFPLYHPRDCEGDQTCSDPWSAETNSSSETSIEVSVLRIDFRGLSCCVVPVEGVLFPFLPSRSFKPGRETTMSAVHISAVHHISVRSLCVSDRSNKVSVIGTYRQTQGPSCTWWMRKQRNGLR